MSCFILEMLFFNSYIICSICFILTSIFCMSAALRFEESTNILNISSVLPSSWLILLSLRRLIISFLNTLSSSSTHSLVRFFDPGHDKDEVETKSSLEEPETSSTDTGEASQYNVIVEPKKNRLLCLASSSSSQWAWIYGHNEPGDCLNISTAVVQTVDRQPCFSNSPGHCPTSFSCRTNQIGTSVKAVCDKNSS